MGADGNGVGRGDGGLEGTSEGVVLGASVATIGSGVGIAVGNEKGVDVGDWLGSIDGPDVGTSGNDGEGVHGFAMIDLPASINERPPPVVPGLPAILPVRVTSDTERNTSSTTRAAVLMGKLLAMLGFDTQLLHSSHVSSGKS